MAKKTGSRRAALTLLDLAVGIAATAAVVVPASAQAPPMPTWTGFYIGGNGGIRSAHANFTGNGYIFDPDGPGGTAPITIPPRDERYKLSGGIFGFQGGYNYQFAPNFLVGVEGDWSWGKKSDTQNASFNVQSADGGTYRLTYASEVELKWQATIRGRLGYVQGPWLFYGTAGAAFTHVNWTDTNSLAFSFGTTITTAASAASKTLTGFVAGAGTEYMFAPNWIARIEYLFENFRSFDVPFGFVSQTGNLDLSNVHIVRFGISYKLGP